MKMMIAAIALSVAFPAVAHAAEAAPAPSEKKMKCCCKDMAKPMKCCEERGSGKAGQDEAAGHDMSQHQQHQQ